MLHKNAKNAKKYNCELCDFYCSSKYNYKIHLSTLKHLNKKNAKNANCLIFKCETVIKFTNSHRGYLDTKRVVKSNVT